METTIFPNSNHHPRVPPYSPCIKNSFAYYSVTRRWPNILTQIIDHLVFQNNSLLGLIQTCQNQQQIQLKLSQGKFIISQISQLKYESARDKEIKFLNSNQNQSQQEILSINLYNQEISKSIAAGKPTWFSASWLLTECYLYQRIHEFFNQSSEWKEFDPFQHQKVKTFQSSWHAVSSLCSSLEQLITFNPNKQFNLEDYLLILKVQFNQFLYACLWGNATDLSLLPNVTELEIQELQKKSSSTLNKNEFILRDDSNLVWETCFLNKPCFLHHHEQIQQGKRIDFVLDNSGFELFTDFILADWIVSNSNHFIQIVFHPKLIPWFVSDVMKKDINQLIESMIEPIQFFKLDTENNYLINLVKKTGLRWKDYFENGVWKILDSELLSFWTNPLPFWDIPSRDNKLFEQLKSSDLVIFKGDLNYRKLTGDAQWETDTSFEEAIGPLNGEFNLLSLRTCKADVCVGLQPGQDLIISKIDSDWRTNGKFALITFSPKNIK